MKKSKILSVLISCFYIAVLTACNSNENTQEIVNTPPEIVGFQTNSTVTIAENTSLKGHVAITVNAIDAEGSIVDYQWSLLSSQNIELQDTETSTVSFEVPLISSEDQNLVIIEAKVTDNNDIETSSIYEQDINDYIMPIIPDIEVKSKDDVELSVTIFGRESKINTLIWSIESEHDLTLFDVESKTVTFVAPDVSETTEIILKLDILTSDSDALNPDGILLTHLAKVTVLPK